MIDLRLGGQSSTPRSTLAAVTAVVGAGVDADAPADPADVQQAVARILRAVEWQRYGSPDGAPPAPRAPSHGSRGREHGQAGGLMLAERGHASTAPRPGALSGDVRTVRRALARRAGWSRRMRAALAPRSVLVALTARGAGRGSANGG